MSIFCAARNCPTDSPENIYSLENKLKAGTFVTILCAGSSRHGYPESHHCHLACASPISSFLLDTWMDASLSEVDDDRRLVSDSENIIDQLYYCGDPLCLAEVLEREGRDFVKTIIPMARQDFVAARAMANEAPCDQLAKNQLIVAIGALKSTALAPATSSDETIVDPSSNSKFSIDWPAR